MEYEQKKTLTNQIAKILTISHSRASDLIDEHPTSSFLLAESFTNATDNGVNSREWLSRTMVALDRSCISTKDDIFVIEPLSGSSLYLQTQRGMQPSGKSLHAIENRRKLIKSLSKQRDYLNGNKKTEGSEISDMTSPDNKSSIFDVISKDKDIYPFRDDFRAYFLVENVENIYYEVFKLFEADIREDVFGLSKQDRSNISYPTPHGGIYLITDATYVKALDIIESISNVSESTGDDLIERVICNISANRALQEMAVVAEQAELGHKIMIEFVDNLNKLGVYHMPHFENKFEVEEYYREIFGRNGLITKGNSKWNPISNNDLEAVYKFAEITQVQYFKSRMLSKVETCLDDWFLFLLVQTALYYSDEKVRGEISGEQKYKPMPWRGAPRNAVVQRTHALELTKSAFGIASFSVFDSKLDANNMKSYSNAIRYKRSHLQMLIYKVFKTWSPSRIQCLSDAFELCIET
ncbi:hypothetical protein [Vibrio scophthalmi]|uniref:Uncharacterized protein n=1 Tax=Vibrio scophthalmi TaxID=45658 RepID=A0A1E3WEP3_9VIBR|nr:hypothetical protein [Vibrio scophthalmi]ODS04295.1 hypothetical protein VSF3289_03426 [Vibrio scophthalmi]